MPLTAATPAPVEFDEFVNMFDDKTREAMTTNLDGFGDAFAGRGVSLNQAIARFRPLLRDIIPVAQNLSDPNTDLQALRRHARRHRRARSRRRPRTQAELFVNLDTTIGALREVARPYIQDSITKGRPALDAAIESFPVQRPFLAQQRGPVPRAAARRAGAARRRRRSSPTRSRSARRRCAAPSRSTSRLEPLLRELQTFAEDPLVPRGIDALTDIVRTLNPTLQYLAPAQLQCNYVTLWFRNVSSLLTEGDTQRHLAAVHHHRHAAGPEQRGRPVLRARQRPDGRQPPAHQPVPEHGRRRASRRSARRATSRTRAARP